MSEIAGSIGEGRVLVFQPATPNPAVLGLALGIQRLWQKSLKAAGRPAACFVALTRIESIEGVVPDGVPIAVGDRGVMPFADWSDATATAALVLSKQSRWGLSTTLAAEGQRARLDTTLIEAKAGEAARTLGTWAFDSTYETLPAHLTDVLMETARRVGTKPAWTSAADLFDSADPGAAMLMLEAMGAVSMTEDGVRVVIEHVLDRLATLVTAAPHSRVVVALVPELLGHLARLGAHDIQLAGWLRRVRKAIGVVPAEWDGLLAAISRDRVS